MKTGQLSAINLSSFHWLYKYKLYHLPFWFIYHYVWWTLRIGDPLAVAHNIFYSPFAFKFFFYLVFQMIGVYFNLYFLIPRFLEKGRYLKYISLVLLTIVLTTSCIVTGYYLGAFLSDNTFQEMYKMEPGDYFYIFESSALPSTIASMTLAMSIKLTKNWLQTKRKEQVLEKEKLETELKFLRAQFNPHFLFNTINSIFVLIHKNPDLASDALAKFSDLLRYQLYECNEPEIPVLQELSYLENFIELQKLRHDHEQLDVTIDIKRPHDPDMTIAPFVLIPFIENAFKHVSHRKDKKNWIRLNLWFDQNQMFFNLINTIQAMEFSSKEFIAYGGIGLQNVKRRLELIYPNEHELTVKQDDVQFSVTLLLKLHEYNTTSRSLIHVNQNL